MFQCFIQLKKNAEKNSEWNLVYCSECLVIILSLWLEIGYFYTACGVVFKNN